MNSSTEDLDAPCCVQSTINMAFILVVLIPPKNKKLTHFYS